MTRGVCRIDPMRSQNFRFRGSRAGRAVAFLSLWMTGLTACADWPQFLGPTRDGVVPGETVPAWPEAGPEVAWRVEVGRGFSGPVAVGDLVLLHHRRESEEVLEAFDRKDGRSRWKAVQPTGYVDGFGFDDGPRGTPCVAGELAYAFGAEGRLSAVRWRDGTPAWSVALGKELGADKGFFGFGCSPLVVTNRVIVQVGGRDGAGIVALDATTGAMAWKATEDEAGYASPVPVLQGGVMRVVVFNRSGVRVLEPRGGQVTARFEWRSRQNASVNAATPLAGPDGVFVTSSYDTGAAWLRWQGAGQLVRGWTAEDALDAHISTPVRRGDSIFGFHGRQEEGGEVRCISVQDGSVRWRSPRTGIGSVLLTGDRLLLLLESGELVLAEAGAARWQPLARAQVLGTGVRAAPALDGELFLARDRQRLVAVRLRKG